MAALEARGLGLGQEDEAQEDEEYLEELVKLLLLEVDGALLLQGFLEVELDYGVQGLEGCFFRVVVVAGAGFVVCHGWNHAKPKPALLFPTRTLGHRFAQSKYTTPPTHEDHLRLIFLHFISIQFFFYFIFSLYPIIS